MFELVKWFDSIAQRVCESLDNFFSGLHAIATVGNSLAGLERISILPVDRRLGDNLLLMADQSRRERKERGKYKIGTGHSHPEDECGFWAYCHMLGYPCVRCGGSNSLRSQDQGAVKCPGPAGTIKQGSYWAGCCKDGGKVKYIGWYDCCVVGSSRPSGGCGTKPFCRGWPNAKNWCSGVGTYYCTVAVHFADADKVCTP